MPIDLEMLLSATSHPLFGYAPFTNNRCGRFSVTTDYNNSDPSLQKSNYLLRRDSKQLNYVQNKSSFETFCESAELDSKEKANKCEDLRYGTQCRKKRVSFADDVGRSLVEVRMIPETAHTSPNWSDDVLSILIGGSKPSLDQGRYWKLASDNPPWNDDKLIELLEKNMVVVESVSVDENADGVLSGKIKVKNLAFEKAVFIRITFDRWVSFVDVNASYFSPKDKIPKMSISYDTFAFRIRIPASASRYEVVEFCAGFKCGNQEYWDNNGGINYRLVAMLDAPKSNTTSEVANVPKTTPKVTFSVTANFNEYSELDAWNRLMYDRPYW